VPIVAPAHPQNRHRPAFGRCCPLRRRRHQCPRRSKAAGSGGASKFSSSETARSDDDSRGSDDDSRKRSGSHKVRSRDGGTPPPGPMRHSLKASRRLLLREEELSYCSPGTCVRGRFASRHSTHTEGDSSASAQRWPQSRICVAPVNPCATAPAPWQYSPRSAELHRG